MKKQTASNNYFLKNVKAAYNRNIYIEVMALVNRGSIGDAVKYLEQFTIEEKRVERMLSLFEQKGKLK